MLKKLAIIQSFHNLPNKPSAKNRKFKIMKYVVYLFHRYYSSGSTKDIAYEKSIFALLTLLFLNIFALLNFIDLTPKLDWFHMESRAVKYLIVFSFFIAPGYLLLQQIIPRSIITKFDERKIKQIKIHGWLLFGYIICSIVLLVIAINYRYVLTP